MCSKGKRRKFGRVNIIMKDWRMRRRWKRAKSCQHIRCCEKSVIGQKILKIYCIAFYNVNCGQSSAVMHLSTAPNQSAEQRTVDFQHSGLLPKFIFLIFESSVSSVCEQNTKLCFWNEKFCNKGFYVIHIRIILVINQNIFWLQWTVHWTHRVVNHNSTIFRW